jgi:hypothetical protein
MKAIRILLTAIAVVGLVALVVPSTAQATTPERALEVTGQTVGPAAISCPAADLCAYTLTYRTGTRCLATPGDSTLWPASCLNKAESIFNNGTPQFLDDVNLYWGSGTRYDTAYACIGQGNVWEDLPSHQEYFSCCPGRRGYREWVDRNVASHRWVQSC